MDKLLSVFELTATYLHKFQFILGVFAFVVLTVGGVFAMGDNKVLGFWLFLIGIWCIGCVIFSEIFSLKESVYLNGEYVSSSQIRNTNSAMGLYQIVFATVWIVGMVIMTILLLLKTF